MKWTQHTPEFNGYYVGTPFSWMKEKLYFTPLNVSRKFGFLGQSESPDDDGAHAWDENPEIYLKRDDEFREGHMELYHDICQNNVVIFYDCPEKEFDIEICHVIGNDFIPVFRYTDN